MSDAVTVTRTESQFTFTTTVNGKPFHAATRALADEAAAEYMRRLAKADALVAKIEGTGRALDGMRRMSGGGAGGERIQPMSGDVTIMLAIDTESRVTRDFIQAALDGMPGRHVVRAFAVADGPAVEAAAEAARVSHPRHVSCHRFPPCSRAGELSGDMDCDGGSPAGRCTCDCHEYE